MAEEGLVNRVEQWPRQPEGARRRWTGNKALPSVGRVDGVVARCRRSHRPTVPKEVVCGATSTRRCPPRNSWVSWPDGCSWNRCRSRFWSSPTAGPPRRWGPAFPHQLMLRLCRGSRWRVHPLKEPVGSSTTSAPAEAITPLKGISVLSTSSFT